ncbi:RHS repeat domain-containing protein [Pelotomaculum propionicicum]|uniref:RHS repeat domain-containing protein n=1 Tax=Pelotomaculum propionicicum TaxID=258475 RepID=UPI003B7EB8AB
MPEITPNLGLKKPLSNETVSRAAYNENLDILESNAMAKGLDAQDINKTKVLNIEIDGRNVTLAYDGSGRLQTITEKDGVTMVDTVTLAYDGSGNLQTLTEIAGGSTITTTLGYTTGKLTSITPVVT